MTRTTTGETELPEPFRELRVERVTKPDGRLLLYYSFPGTPMSGSLVDSDRPDDTGPTRSGEKSPRPRKG